MEKIEARENFQSSDGADQRFGKATTSDANANCHPAVRCLVRSSSARSRKKLKLPTNPP